MYDFAKGDDRDDSVRRASIFEELGQRLYENVFARENTHIATIHFSDLVSFFMKEREKYGDAEQCLVFYKKKNGKFELCQVMMDSEGRELRVNNRMCVGRRLVVDELGSSILKWFDGSDSKVMNKDTIF